MPQLAVMRKGWENEHLAAFLLSQIAFVANPLTVADDIGSDFFCTLFKPLMQNGKEMLSPLNSFAIQVKSSPGIVDAIKVIGYLEQLELPYFLGVTDRSKLSLSLYSGEYLPMMFSEHGKPEALKLRPIDDPDAAHSEPYSSVEKKCELKLPFVAALRARDSSETVSQNAKLLAKLCSRMHANISTWKLDEYIFQLRQADQVQIMAGSGSAQTFRRNFYFRLGEVFYNLKWLLGNRSSDFRLAEFEMYERMYMDMARRGINLPEVVTSPYQQLKELLNDKNPA